MGLNVDLTQMLGAPSVVSCPRCKTDVATNFDDYDIECGNPNPSKQAWSLHVYCDSCELEFQYEFTIVRQNVNRVVR
jgi:hypothetical protein